MSFLPLTQGLQGPTHAHCKPKGKGTSGFGTEGTPVGDTVLIGLTQ